MMFVLHLPWDGMRVQGASSQGPPELISVPIVPVQAQEVLCVMVVASIMYGGWAEVGAGVSAEADGGAFQVMGSDGGNG
ncbi:hypothetical protein C0993_007680 [Termitomyces sp. T159_Od127]|nr:hypothetical protein C0993_007680 [Termitomyces sp. T159_Od127]